MSNRLPSLHALRAFEVCARLGAFNKAADELNLSAAAVSQHIRTLEATLSTQLFVRTTRKVTLTADGVLLADACSRAFSELGDVVARLRYRGSRQSVTIALGALLAARWLTTKLSLFWEKFPDVDLTIAASGEGSEADRHQADIFIVWDDSNRLDGAARFMSVSNMPVASPDYVQRNGAPESIETLFDHPVIHQRSKSDWQHWLQLNGAQLPRELDGIVIADANVAIRCALAGQGIALGSLPLIDEEIAAGRLVPVLPAKPAWPFAYHLFVAQHSASEPQINEIADWLLEQSAD